MSLLVIGDYSVEIPDELLIEEYNQFRDMPDFLRSAPLDWEIVKNSPTVYTVRLGEHWLSISLTGVMDKPEDWARFLADQFRMRELAQLEDVSIHGIPGKAFGNIGEPFSCKEWRLKVDGSNTISFDFQGPGRVPEQTWRIVDSIMNSLKHRESARNHT